MLRKNSSYVENTHTKEELYVTFEANRILERRGEIFLHVCQSHVIMRALGTGHTRNYSREIQLKDIGEDRVLAGVIIVPK